MNSCSLVFVLLCAAAACCTATRNFGDRLGNSGVQVHVESITYDETTTIKIQNRLPTEDVDTLAISCISEFEGQSIGDLLLEEVSPYAVMWGSDIYGPADLWSCHFEWVDHNLVIGKTIVWKNQGSVTWKLDARGLAYFDASSNIYVPVTEWEEKSSGTAASE